MWQNIIWLAFIGGLMFLMFRRGGCCGGHSHGHRSSSDHSQQETGIGDNGIPRVKQADGESGSNVTSCH